MEKIPTRQQALDAFTVDDLNELSRAFNPDPHVKDVIKCVMVMLYGEKYKHNWVQWKQKLKDPKKVIEDFKDYHRTPVDWQLDMIKSIVKAKWFNYPNIKQYSKIAARMSIWIVDFYEKGVIHHEEEEEKAKIEAARPKKSDKVLTATELEALRPKTVPTGIPAQNARPVSAIKIVKENIKKITPRAKLNPSLYQNAKLQKEMNAKRKDQMIGQLGKYMNFKAKPKMTMKDLKAMNNVDAKKDYMNMILADDAATAKKLAQINEKVAGAEDNLENAEKETRAVADNFNHEIDEINEAIDHAANENGISKDEYFKNYKFEEFSITAAVPRGKCEICKKGLKCRIHNFQRTSTMEKSRPQNQMGKNGKRPQTNQNTRSQKVLKR